MLHGSINTPDYVHWQQAIKITHQKLIHETGGYLGQSKVITDATEEKALEGPKTEP